MGKILEATEGFACEFDGERYMVSRGSTRIDSEHPLAKAYPQYFRPVADHLTYNVEQATANPGEARDRRARIRQAEPKAEPTQEAVPEKPAVEEKADEKPSGGLTSSDLRRKDVK